MKNILFLIPTLSGGGAEKVLVNLVNNLNKQEYNITVKTLFKNDIYSKSLHENIKFFRGKIKQFSGSTHILKLFSPRFLYKFFIKDTYDIIVSYLEGPTARIISGCPSKQTKTVCWIHTEHQTLQEFAHSFRSVKEAQNCYNNFDTIVCVADTVKQNFLTLSNYKKKCLVLYNTNQTDKILEWANENLNETFSSDVNVFSIGRLIPVKGYLRLIYIHKKLISEGFLHNIYILGDGAEYKNLSLTIQNLQLEDTFHLLGFKENPYKYLKKADLFICSSFKEGFSTAVSESLILGIPTISTCCSGAYELLGNNNEYGIVTENSEEGIYQGLKQMLDDHQLRENYAKQAKIRGQNFSTKKTVAAVEEMLESL